MATNNPSFICSSGKLLWGQLHCIAEGHLSKDSDGETRLPDASIRGTIFQRDFQYKVNAALGEWNVKEIMYRVEQEEHLAGFVVFNKKDADPSQVLDNCIKLGMSSSEDRRIIYVNRYDWGLAHEIQPASEQLMYGSSEISDDFERDFRKMLASRIMLVDADFGLSVINQMKANVPDIPRNALIKDTLTVENQPVGVHLACPHTEYELGWMIFDEHQQLIAFIYDGAYTGLSGEFSLKH